MNTQRSWELAGLVALRLGGIERGKESQLLQRLCPRGRSRLPALERLSLEKNQIGDTGLSSFADALGKGGGGEESEWWRTRVNKKWP